MPQILNSFSIIHYFKRPKIICIYEKKGDYLKITNLRVCVHNCS